MAISPRTAKVDILQGEDNERLTELYQDVQLAEQAHRDAQRRGAPSRVGDELPSITDAREALDAFLTGADERAETVRLRSIGRRRFRDLRLEHEPRKVKTVVDGEEVDGIHEDDAPFGVNTATFPDALLTYADPDDPEVCTILEPEFNTLKERRKFLDDDCAEGDFEKLWTTAFFLNSEQGADPKALRSSLARPTFVATSG